MAKPDHPDVEDLVDLGALFRPDNLPDQGGYIEVLVGFPACMPFLLFGESITDMGLDRSEKIFALVSLSYFCPGCKPQYLEPNYSRHAHNAYSSNA